MEVQTATSSSSAQATTTPRASALTSDFKDFVKLLTAQAKYQDPLEPISSTDYVAQLAQFSSVEQQTLTNELMSLQIEYSVATAVASLSGWVGMEARAVAPAQFDGDPVTVFPYFTDSADRAQLVVYDADDTEVQRIDLDLEKDRYEWSGLDESTGEYLESGAYRFEVESFSNGELVDTIDAETYGRVTEAQLEGGQILLMLESGAAISTADIQGIRNPSQAG